MNLEGRGCRCEFREEELHKYRLDAESNGSTQCRNPRGPRLSASRAKRGRY